MTPVPHHYEVTARSGHNDDIELVTNGLPVIRSAPPADFGGPGDRWSPEQLLIAAAVDCFILTFRAIARASGLEWLRLECHADGTLDRVGDGLEFVRIDTTAMLAIRQEADRSRAERLLDKAKRQCLITRSLRSEQHLVTEIRVKE